MDNLNLLVTGGCGFIGSNFCNKFFNIFNKLIIIDKLTYAGNMNNIKNIIDSNNVIFINEDINNVNFEKIYDMYNINYIINFAAETHVDNSYNNFNLFFNNNVLTVEKILNSLLNREKNIRFLHFSTDEVYGPSENNAPFFETSNFNPTNPYSASKAAAELVINTYKYSYNLPIIIIRCNNVYGLNQYPEKVIPNFILNALNNKDLNIQGDGSKTRDFIYIDDVISALKIIIEKGEVNEIYNIGNDNPIKIVDLANLIIKKIGKGKINFVKDRPFNDYRYLVDCNKLKKLGWQLKYDNFDNNLDIIITHMK
jgi:dTDP-glucose 4,6-dehydratase